MRHTLGALLALTMSLGVGISACADDADSSTGPTPTPCELACDVPPASVCLDASTLRVFAEDGRCESNSCVFSSVDVPCALGCQDGACLGQVDLCDSVVCETPPSPCHAPVGQCSAGICAYEPLTGNTCDDGDSCTTADTCSNGACLGQPLACDAPPAATCAGDAITSFASPGQCDAGSCTYPSTSTACPLGCADGSCLGDPCAGVVCDSPPSSCHQSTGACQGGVCSYALADGKSCDDGDGCTDGDTCSGGVCGGTTVACNAPPAATCQDGTTLLTYDSAGTCGNGGCSYASQAVACPGGCQDDACVGDPCAGVVCDSPPTGCFDAAGTCVNGTCQYAYDNGATCDDGNACTSGDQCTNGVCSGDAVSCSAPPADGCIDATTLRVYQAAGACAAGGCDYPSTDVTCEFGCDVAACTGDPCAGVTCDTPPATTCTGPNTLTSYAAAGSCGGGACSYAAVNVTCQNGCDNAACVVPTGIVISEIVYNSDGFPDTESFIELHGPPGAALDGLSLVGVNGNGGVDYVTIELSGTTDSAGIYLVGHSGAAPELTALMDLATSDVDLQNGPDSVQLRFGDQVLDALAYGSFGTTSIAAGEGEAHPGHAVGESLSRDSGYTDTDSNIDDFSAGVPTPGEAALACDDTCDTVGATECDGSSTVVTCGDYDGDGCNEWGAPSACEAGTDCADGLCACADACPADGATECTNGQVRTCSMVGTCLGWSATTACDSGACADATACFAAPDLTITANQELCGLHVVDEFIVQGGATVTCSTGELRVHARTIFIDPASSINLSRTSSEASGGKYGFCTDSQLNSAATGGGGGGNGSAGSGAATVEWEKEWRLPGCSGGWQCYEDACVNCTGGGGGGARGSSTNLVLSRGGRGGDGCYSSTSSSPGSYSRKCNTAQALPLGGKGGGAVELIAEETLDILGSVMVTGEDGQHSTLGTNPMSGSGGGAGGTVLLMANVVSVAGNIQAAGGDGLALGSKSYSCGNENVNGADGGNGRLKVVYSGSYDISGAVVGATQSISHMPPRAFDVAIDGVDATDSSIVVNDSFAAATFSWTAPFAEATGFWYLLNQDPRGEVTAANGTYTTDTTVTFDRSAFTSTGRWYLHVVSVHGPTVTIGTVSNSTSILVVDAAAGIQSDSHPDPSAWTVGTTVVASWTAPSGTTTDDFARAFYRVDRNSQAAYGDGSGWSEVTTPSLLLTTDANGDALTGFGYYLHVVVEDHYGNVSSSVAHYRLQIGDEPATTSFYGYVKDANGAALEGATIRFEPFNYVQTTSTAGYFIFDTIYEGSYTAYVQDASGDYVATDVVISPTASPYDITP